MIGLFQENFSSSSVVLHGDNVPISVIPRKPVGTGEYNKPSATVQPSRTVRKPVGAGEDWQRPYSNPTSPQKRNRSASGPPCMEPVRRVPVPSRMSEQDLDLKFARFLAKDGLCCCGACETCRPGHSTPGDTEPAALLP